MRPSITVRSAPSDVLACLVKRCCVFLCVKVSVDIIHGHGRAVVSGLGRTFWKGIEQNNLYK